MTRLFKFVKAHFILFLIVTYLAIKKSKNKVVVNRVDRFVADMKHILSWTKIHNLKDEGQKYFIDHKCKFTNCYLTSDKNFLGDLRYFDLVLFNLQDVSLETERLPELRSSSQKYMFVANDSSDNYPVCNPVYDDFFNWTWSYRYVKTLSYSNLFEIYPALEDSAYIEGSKHNFILMGISVFSLLIDPRSSFIFYFHFFSEFSLTFHMIFRADW